MSSNQIGPAYLTTLFQHHFPHVRESIQVVLLSETTINVLPRKLKTNTLREKEHDKLQNLESNEELRLRKLKSSLPCPQLHFVESEAAYSMQNPL